MVFPDQERQLRISFDFDKALKKRVISKYGGECQICFKMGRTVHHIKPISHFRSDEDLSVVNSESNLTLYCNSCHRAEHNRMQSFGIKKERKCPVCGNYELKARSYLPDFKRDCLFCEFRNQVNMVEFIQRATPSLFGSSFNHNFEKEKKWFKNITKFCASFFN